MYDRLYGDKGEDAGKEGRGGNIEITCAEQVQLYGDRGENIERRTGSEFEINHLIEGHPLMN